MQFSWKKRVMSVGALGFVALGVIASPAHAEGSWSSYISKWLTGQESRQWYDGNADATSTTVALSGCYIPIGQTFKSVTLGLYRDRGILPDESKGLKLQTCSTFNWGDVSAGNYHFTLKQINGVDGGYGLNFSASSVATRY